MKENADLHAVCVGSTCFKIGFEVGRISQVAEGRGLKDLTPESSTACQFYGLDIVCFWWEKKGNEDHTQVPVTHEIINACNEKVLSTELSTQQNQTSCSLKDRNDAALGM